MDESIDIAMRAEWEAWNNLSKDLQRLGFSGWDDPKLTVLHAGIVFWGEMLAAIRSEQDSELRLRACSEALGAYVEALKGADVPFNEDEYEAPF